MKILVTVKPVADPNTPADDWIAIQRGEEAAVNYVANPFDLIAVEQALQLKECGADDICIISIAPEHLLPQVRSAIAMGVNRAIVVDPQDQELDWYTAAAVFKYIIDRENPDMLLMGKQATDDDASQVGPMLAGMLGWPQATFISDLALSDDKASVKVGREVDDGVEILDVKLPAVITCDLRLNEPRYPTLPNILKSKKVPMEKLLLQDLPIDNKPMVTVEGYSVPPGRSGEIVMVHDAHELVAILKDRKLIG